MESCLFCDKEDRHAKVVSENCDYVCGSCTAKFTGMRPNKKHELLDRCEQNGQKRKIRAIEIFI